MRELVTAADHERVKGVLGIQLSSGLPIEARLLGPNSNRSSYSSAIRRVMARRLNWNWLRRWALRNHRWIFIDGNELKIFELKSEIIDRFKNQIAVLVANVAKLRGRHADKHHLTHRMTEAGWFEPGFVGMSVNFLFQCAENAHP